MTLIKSISGIRGTIGGSPGDSLTPQDIVKFTTAYASWLRKDRKKEDLLVVVGRDARISGEMVSNIVTATLSSMGVDVLDLGLSTTPTVEVAVVGENADGGIIITASHNPVEWNALKLLNSKGEFLDARDGNEIITIADSGSHEYVNARSLGWYRLNTEWNDIHVEMVCDQPLVNKAAIAGRNIKVVLDTVNSSGSLLIPSLLEKLGVTLSGCVNCEPDGLFRHNPEPLPENLKDLSQEVIKRGADLGFAVDPDSDRLAIVCEDGTMFGEEYTLVAVADYVMGKNPGPAVSNLSSTRALRDIAGKYDQRYFASAVGEVNVVETMKREKAVIGGEGNGGVIYPPLHYGRDALMGIALFLSYFAEKRMTATKLRDSLPYYHIAKKKVVLDSKADIDAILKRISGEYPGAEKNMTDGLRIDFEKSWVHIRRSNTEPIIRIYAEAGNDELANSLAEEVIKKVKKV